MAGERDLLTESSEGKGLTAVTDTLAVDDPNIVNSVFIHGSSDVVAKQGGTDVSANWAVWRMKRVWQRKLSPTASGGDPIGGPIGEGYVEALGSRRMYNDTKEVAAGNWVDCVGWVLPTQVDYYERTLHEFGIGAQDPVTRKVRDDSGGLYVIVIIDLSPQWYRVRMSKAVTLTSAQWKAARGLGGASPIPKTTPFKTEATTGAQAIAWAPDDGWQSWGTYNEQLLAPVTHP
jgi:hypothetical protein